MPTARTIFEEIFDNEEAFRLFCSIAASGEAQGGWENGKYASGHPSAVKVISSDEDNHLAYCHEELLLRLAAAGHGELIQRTQRATALAEIAIYRDVSTAVMARLAQALGWPRWKAAALAAGIRAVYAYERLGGWRRLVSLRMSARRNALGGPAPAQPSHV